MSEVLKVSEEVLKRNPNYIKPDLYTSLFLSLYSSIGLYNEILITFIPLTSLYVYPNSSVNIFLYKIQQNKANKAFNLETQDRPYCMGKANQEVFQWSFTFKAGFYFWGRNNNTHLYSLPGSK